MDVALRADALVRRFGPTVAVDGLSFAVARGETFGLLGHNGAGKTTTIRLLNGVLTADAGRAEVLGFDAAVDGTRIRARTGVLTETPSLDERMSARENLRFAGRLHGMRGRDLEHRVGELLEAFGLADRADDRTSGYSRGMKQRVALARTLLHDPDVLFLDEPTAALDPVAAREVHELVEGFRRRERRTVVLCTHNLVEAQRLCDRVAILRHGQAVAVGTPAELLRAAGGSLAVEIEVDAADRDRAAVILREAGHAADVLAEGVGFTAPDREAIPPVVAALAAAGVRVYRVGSAATDLEAAYFAIHENDGASPGGRGDADARASGPASEPAPGSGASASESAPGTGAPA